MRVNLRYGRGEIPVTLPNDADVTVVRKPAMPALSAPPDAIAEALRQPVNSPPLGEVAQGAACACIAICDITRPVPNHLFLRPLIETLLNAGIPPTRIRVLVATGLHRPNVGEELAELVGDPWVLDTVEVANHFARDDAQHVELGRTQTRGTAVRIDRRFVEADLRIVTGLVEPHFMAGYSGGRKLIAPGLAHAETITTLHSARFIDHSEATNCILDGNPLHEEQLEIVRMLGDVLAVNTVINEERELSFVNFGEILAGHEQAVIFARSFCELPLPRRFPTVLTSAAGYPLDKTYYQTVKGIVSAAGILEPGGDLIVVSECSEGMGSTEFVDAQRRLVELGPQEFGRSLVKKLHADIDEWQTQMLLEPLRTGNIHLYSDGLNDAQGRLTGVNVVSSLDEAAQASLRRSRDRAVAVIPEGPYVVPLWRRPAAP